MDDPHAEKPLKQRGPELRVADGAVVFVHGRGATADSILGLYDEIGTDGVAGLAPQAANNTWYPAPFMQPRERNEPGITSGLAAIDRAIERATDAGIDRDAIALVGFSQGACLTSDYLARHPTAYGGAGILSGGLIGAEVAADAYTGELAGTPVFVGCSDTDPYIPLSRVHETISVLEALGADVTEAIYEHRPHGVYEEELGALAELTAALSA